MSAVTRKRISSFTRAESGSVAINFGLTIIPIIFMVGSAVDYSNAVRARANLQVATDSTALALGQKGMDQSESQLFAAAKAFLGAVADDSAASIVSAEKLNMGGNSSKICVTAQTRTETAFMKLAGYEYVTVQSNSCVTSGSANFEIAMVLDTSGSMNNGAGGSSKIAALRTAGQNFVDYMYGPKMNGAGMKISVVPFSWGVAVDPGQYRGASWVDTNGASSLHWAGYTGQTGLATSRFDLFNWMKAKKSSWDWAGCFESLPFPLNVQEDGPIAGNPDSYMVPSLWPDEPDDYEYVNSYLSDNKGVCTTTASNDSQRQSRVCKYKNATTLSSYGPNLACSSQPLMRLSNNKSDLKTYIGNLDADGNTNIHEGVTWGWRTLSPKSVFAEGKEYEALDNRKVLVVMTDGMNTWGAINNDLNRSYYSAYGFFTSTDGTGRNPRLPPNKIDGGALPNPTSNATGRAAMDDLTRRSCQNARNAGIVIYTIGFTTQGDPIDAAGKQLLKDCAGDPARYYEATDAASINVVFGQIAASIGKLRLLQ
jgi:Flp pilus assembly protein TadG